MLARVQHEKRKAFAKQFVNGNLCILSDFPTLTSISKFEKDFWGADANPPFGGGEGGRLNGTLRYQLRYYQHERCKICEDYILCLENATGKRRFSIFY